MLGLSTTRRAGAPATRQQRRWLAPFQEMEDIVERLWSDQGDGLSIQLLAPPLDMTETDKEIKLRMDLPGISPKEVDIQVNGNQLTVSGERKEENEENGYTYHRLERRIGKFSRTVLLPCQVEDEKVDARYQDGVLNITMPKTVAATTRHIEIKT
ncbi:MAG: Hsp20/alpha crystallin family protein [Pirellula sp.]|jgi:HSP20 family protein